MHANVGDEIMVDMSELGTPPRRGKVLAVRGEDGHEHYEVQWSDGHVSIFFPGGTAHLVYPGDRSAT